MGFRISRFEDEIFIVARPEERSDFVAEVTALGQAYADALRQSSAAPGTAVFRRVFVSDLLNQRRILARSALTGDNSDPVAVSLVQPPPLPAARIALLAYHIDRRGLQKQALSPNHLRLICNGQRQVWSSGIAARASQRKPSVHNQTETAFVRLVEMLDREGANLRDHCVRTWIYLKAIDLFYQEFVDSRRALFVRHGLTSQTHFIASTGIEGACGGARNLVGLDALSMPDLIPGQVSHLNDFERMCPTKDYDVTFERATRVEFGDRVQIWISGTASIDRYGKVLFAGDVARQLDRALENVEALLRASGADLSNLMYLIVYLRDASDHAVVAQALRRRLGGLPLIVVHAAVCRPAWLVEIEGLALVKNCNSRWPRF